MSGTEHVIYYRPGGLQNLAATMTDLQMQDMNLTTNQVDCILRELTENDFSGNANLAGNNQPPSEWGLALRSALTVKHSSTIIVSP